MSESEDLVAEIARRLELGWQYVAHVPAWDMGRVAEIRSAGRRAGRMLGYRVVTMTTDPEDRDDGLVVVVVAVSVPPGEDDREPLGSGRSPALVAVPRPDTQDAVVSRLKGRHRPRARC